MFCAVSAMFAALHVYLTAIIADTAQNIPGGTLDRRYLNNLFEDLSGDALAVIRNATEEMREHENWRASRPSRSRPHGFLPNAQIAGASSAAPTPG